MLPSVQTSFPDFTFSRLKDKAYLFEARAGELLSDGGMKALMLELFTKMVSAVTNIIGPSNTSSSARQRKRQEVTNWRAFFISFLFVVVVY